MATSKPDFLEAQSFSPAPYGEPPRERGCFFYGCLISSVLGLLALIGVGIFSYVVYRSFVRIVAENTDTAPRELPKVELPVAAQQTLNKRIESFKKAIDAGVAAEPLVLTAAEVNALIEQNSTWKGQVFVTIDGEKLRGKLSISLDKFSNVLEKIGIAVLRGRYFNGEVELKASLNDDILNVMIESLEVNGRLLPKKFVEAVNKSTVEFTNDPKLADETRKIESLEIKDGTIIIKGRDAKKVRERAGFASPSRTPR